jgi:hypothetical protein
MTIITKTAVTSLLRRTGLAARGAAAVAANNNNYWRCYSADKRLTEDTMSQNVRKMEYAVRGQVVIVADELQRELEANPRSHSYTKVLYTNVGEYRSLALSLCGLGFMDPTDQFFLTVL